MRVPNLGIGGAVLGATALTIPLNILPDMRAAKKEHKSQLAAGVKSAVRNNWQNLILMGMQNQMKGIGALLLISSAAGISSGLNNVISYRNSWIRSAATPFSARYEHSDWAAQAQQRGMQSITGIRGYLGSEAANFAQRYGRR